MFTGLVQTLGQLTRIDPTHLNIRWGTDVPPTALKDAALGDSIAVDGVCLTVERLSPEGFVATASPETLDRSTLGALPEGAWVNLEASLRVGSKVGGHFVTGHVDGLGYLERAIATNTSWELKFIVPEPRLARYVVSKGSIAVNGISLTVADCSPSGDWFTVAVIPVTYGDTNLQYLQSGQGVNLEGDLLGKYVEKFLTGANPAPALQPETVSLEFLSEHGYL
ncbi:MAG: riboflavin synthase [Leptolyngbya sp. RL_3_1]|nr:riboflavin synthase [Leptolyngbya sp. RL_3_1]